MNDLIARLEAASEGNHALDRLIHRTIWREAYEASEPRNHLFAAKAQEPPEPYTTSLDAALTLLPPHSLWVVGQQEDAIARVLPPTGDGWTGSKEITATARTPALALCIAALRARAPAPGERE